MQVTLNRLNRLFSFEDIVEKYGGPPKVWESLRPFLPVWQHHDGKPIYLESQVDDFLRAVHLRWSEPANTSSPAPAPDQPVADDYFTISEAQPRFLGGKRSKGWWYKQAKSGRLKYQQTGGSILLKSADIVAFIEAMRREGRAIPVENTDPEETPPVSTPSSKKSSKRRGAGDQSSGFRFFGQ